jgi:hypothetical protein
MHEQIRKLEQQLFHLRGQVVSDASIKEEHDIERKLCELFECEDIMARHDVFVA